MTILAQVALLTMSFHKICSKSRSVTRLASIPSPTSVGCVSREVFHVQEEVLCVPKLYLNIPTCILRVIDNDTGHELKQVFQKVAPHVFTKNHVSRFGLSSCGCVSNDAT